MAFVVLSIFLILVMSLPREGDVPERSVPNDFLDEETTTPFVRVDPKVGE